MKNVLFILEIFDVKDVKRNVIQKYIQVNDYDNNIHLNSEFIILNLLIIS